jgi:hypothetical protein
LPWLFAFIFVVILIESKRLKRLESQASSKNNL